MTENWAKRMVMFGALLLCAGCVTPHGPDFVAQIDDILAEWEVAILAADVDAILSFYAEDFDSEEHGDKDSFAQFLAAERVQNILPRIVLDSSERQIKLTQTTHGLRVHTEVTVNPILIVVDGQERELSLTLQLKWGRWKIVGQSGGGGR